MKRELLTNEAVAATILTHVMQSKDSRPDAVNIFGLLLDEARMGIENDSQYGEVFLKNAERAIEAQIAAGACRPLHLMKVAALYRRAGLPVPDILIIDPVGADMPAEVPVPDLDDALATLAAEIKAAGGGPYQFLTAARDDGRHVGGDAGRLCQSSCIVGRSYIRALRLVLAVVGAVVGTGGCGCGPSCEAQTHQPAGGDSVLFANHPRLVASQQHSGNCR